MESEWIYSLNVEDIGDEPYEVVISPNEEERALLGKRMGLVSLDSLEVSFVISREAGAARFYVRGALKAALVQKCVSSTDLVPAEIAEEFEAWFADPGQVVSLAKVRHKRESEKTGAEKPILSEREDPEEIIEGQLRLGELSAEHLLLAINPYPRAQGYEAPEGEDKVIAKAGEDLNPFAALKNWKAKPEE